MCTPFIFAVGCALLAVDYHLNVTMKANKKENKDTKDD
jgi:hypothetical protein